MTVVIIVLRDLARAKKKEKRWSYPVVVYATSDNACLREHEEAVSIRCACLSANEAPSVDRVIVGASSGT